MVPPYLLAPADASVWATAMKQWASSIALSTPARHAVTAVIDAVVAGNRGAAAAGIEHLVKVATPQLDAGSIAELHELARELA